MPWLEVKPKDADSYRIDIDTGQKITVGRSGTNELTLADDPAVSRVHAEFSFDGETCLVQDRGSHNGTYVQERKVTEPMAIGAGTWVTVGNTLIRLMTEENESRANAVTAPMIELESGQSVVMSVADIMESVHVSREEVDAAASSEHVSSQLKAFAILNRAAARLLAQRPLEEVLELVIDMVFELASPDRAALMLLEGDPPLLKVGASRGMTVTAGHLPVSRTITDLVLNRQQSVMTSDALADDRFVGAESVMIQNVRSAMCVPLWNNKRVTGLIYADMQRMQRFSKMDLEALTLVANVAAVKIDNVRLFLREQKMKEIERELQAAARIQRRLLPTEPPSVAGYEIVGHNEPCFDVGGDYFDHFVRNGDKLAVAIGDVSGKGMSAALLMASVQASLHAHSSTRAEVSELVSQLNRAVCKNSSADKFSTFFYCEIDVATGSLRYCNAGHNPPILLRAASGEIQLLKGGGMILGFDPEVVYDTHETHLEPGDLIVGYSDGVTESHDPDDEEFGEDRLIETVRAHSNESVDDVRHRVDAAVEKFVRGMGQFDDYTLVLVRRSRASS